MKFSVVLSLGLATLADLAAAQGGWIGSCKSDWRFEGNHLIAECRRKDGSWMKSKQDMNLCIGHLNGSGALIAQNAGNAWIWCRNMQKVSPASVSGECRSRNGEGMYMKSTLDMNSFMTNDNGYLWCMGHRSAPI